MNDERLKTMNIWLPSQACGAAHPTHKPIPLKPVEEKIKKRICRNVIKLYRIAFLNLIQDILIMYAPGNMQKGKPIITINEVSMIFQLKFVNCLGLYQKWG